MRLANLTDRLVILTDGGAIDVAAASDGRFGPDPQSVYDVWPEFVAWAGSGGPGPDAPLTAVDPAALGPAVPRPRQIFAVGLNYRDHTAESGFAQPTDPLIFTKFPSCLFGPAGDIVLSGEQVDWEIELVAVLGRAAYRVSAADAWDHIAGLAIGQDLSDRAVQMRGTPPQFSLGKSFPGYGPVGPWLTTVDELADPDQLDLVCTLNGEQVQVGNTRDMVFPVTELVAYLSGVGPLYPGDLIFTGTPPGVGMGRRPPRYLAPGDVLESRIAGLGELRHRLVAAS
ncbi:fumarylacetoacetate hydrolase family protein [Solwaraspora sp. WMMD1047]|uniref:fumarylacetoacetate hydrolase family protein n=1 Tax=Solwaraspora sp. WMMD1047 TaxID=3016102 RepID=UPI0024179A13|nr:fumarylacetoacetate hydrolase family protein [Solwaraspora sp. WMMD1047]MDG4831486.1 fumarylacetoacetate hydrolase family protein [Solwaraspora sp. WMMD1047]